MYYCKNIEIWYLLISLLRSTSQHLSHVEGKESNTFIVNCDPREHNVGNKDDNDYTYLIESKPRIREEREIQEYEDYKEEKEMPNLSKAGLSLFSWWKSEPDAKRSKNGTFPPLTNDTTVDIGITVDPVAISTDADASNVSIVSDTSRDPTYITTCYTVSPECSQLIIGTPVTCCSDEAENQTTVADVLNPLNFNNSDNNTTVSSNYITNAAQPMTITAGNGNNVTNATFTTAALNVSTGNVSAVVTTPQLLNIVGGGMILPVFQLPMTPVIVVNTAPPVPPKIKSLNGINYNKEPLVIKSKAYNQSNINRNPLNLSFSNCNKIRNKESFEQGLMSEIIRYDPMTLSFPIKNAIIKNDSMETTNLKNGNTTYSVIGNLNSKLTNHVNQSSMLYRMENKHQTNESLGKKSNETATKLTEKGVNCHYNMFKHSESKDLSDQVSLEKPFKKHPRETSIINERMNNFNVNTSDISSEKGYCAVKKDNFQLAENNAETNIENNYNFRRYVKYNDTYLSQKSNISTNLVALCKNVTCKDNDYLTQCCSRTCPSGKCKGEDFSYLLPIPGDTTTVTSTVKAECNPICMELNIGVGSERVSMKNGKFKVNFFSIPKQSRRVVRENDISDFVKFQLMHGMTAPDGKDLMNALKAAKAQVQKVNREFRSNNARNIFQLNTNDQNLHQLTNVEKITLPKKEPENFISPLNTNKILEELRATISNSLLHANLKQNPLQKEGYRTVRNQGLNDQLECIIENKMVLENLKKESEKELDRLSLLETRRREEEELFNKERENDLKELKTIQELIHRELESRTTSHSSKRTVSDIVKPLIDKNGSLKKESTYSKILHNIENSAGNSDIDNFIFKKVSALGSNTSNSIRHNSSAIGIQKFPELEIKNSDNPHDKTLLVLNLGPNEDMLTGDQRSKREDFNNEKNKILNEKVNKFLCSS